MDLFTPLRVPTPSDLRRARLSAVDVTGAVRAFQTGR
jgi:hypothetical protein